MLPEFQDRRFVELLKKSVTLTCLIALAFSKMAATLVFVTDWTTGSFCFSLRRRLKDLVLICSSIDCCLLGRGRGRITGSWNDTFVNCQMYVTKLESALKRIPYLKNPQAHIVVRIL
jgi:hypothetical protein